MLLGFAALRVTIAPDIAAGVAYLASSESAYVTGQVLYIDGGMHAQLRPPELDRSLPPGLSDLCRRETAGEPHAEGDKR